MVSARYAVTPAAQKLPPRERPLDSFLANSQPLTIQRLRQLKPGQTFVYYRGHFGFDLERSDARSPYWNLLSRIRDEAKQLEARGKVKLSEIRITRAARDRRAQDLIFFEYVATGVR